MIRHNVSGDVESRAAMNKIVGALAKVHRTHIHIDQDYLLTFNVLLL